MIYNEVNYKEFINYLKSLEDLKYKAFHSKLTLENNLIGIRTPILKKIAKDISANDIDSFIKCNKHEYYEEVMIHGLLIGYIKDFDIMTKYLDNYLKYITNWALCDLTCSNLKIFKKNQDKGFSYILKLINSTSPFTIRVGVVLLLNYYINDNYIDKIFDICNNIKNNDYYVLMSISWLISICFIKYQDKTLSYLEDNNLNTWTFNKAIDKIKDSKKVSKDVKLEINLLKKKGV